MVFSKLDFSKSYDGGLVAFSFYYLIHLGCLEEIFAMVYLVFMDAHEVVQKP
jgi:hypothetical protein